MLSSKYTMESCLGLSEDNCPTKLQNMPNKEACGVSRASQRNALLIQHCYSPYRTTQFEKTIKKRQKGPVLAIKGPFGDLGGPDLVPTAPHWPAWVGFMVTTYFDMYRLNTRAGVLPRSASSHFFINIFRSNIFLGLFLCILPLDIISSNTLEMWIGVGWNQYCV